MTMKFKLLTFKISTFYYCLKHKMTWLLKCDSGQPIIEFTPAIAGLETIRETVSVPNGSREI